NSEQALGGALGGLAHRGAVDSVEVGAVGVVHGHDVHPGDVHALRQGGFDDVPAVVIQARGRGREREPHPEVRPGRRVVLEVGDGDRAAVDRRGVGGPGGGGGQGPPPQVAIGPGGAGAHGRGGGER